MRSRTFALIAFPTAAFREARPKQSMPTRSGRIPWSLSISSVVKRRLTYQPPEFERVFVRVMQAMAFQLRNLSEQSMSTKTGVTLGS